MFWPRMSAEIKDQVEKCSVCAEFQAKNASQPMLSHQIPDRPWSKIATDLFTLHSKNYITVVDYFSDFIEVSELQDTTSTSVIKALKEQFSRHGIPDTVVSDNGSQFSSQEFHEFALSWEFNHVTSSPHHPKSNGKAESSVKIVKQLFKKAERDRQDPWLALLDYRNTPTEGVRASPAQRLMSRRTRTLLPTAASLLRLTVNHSSVDSLQLKRQKVKFYHDKHVRLLPELVIGQEVRVTPLRKNQTWEQGICTEKLSDRSYIVQSGGTSLRRNRQFLKFAREPSVQANTDANLDNVAHRDPVPAVLPKPPQVATFLKRQSFSTWYQNKDPQHSFTSEIQGF